MVTVSLRDDNLIENVKSIRYLQTQSGMKDDEIQRLYDNQIKKEVKEHGTGESV